ncbi:glutaredoxin domain-containing protein [Clohesyomyces aquaticus]|uniref:Glutaredoxin domain-containing protein n=1 Tax=Clohesyomyces aquaticus TaxID=1231657 RepID=A0A1Y1ZHD9_9PLEO|nr:glutaredoxin domain-containing protein [Clohesyomyces aquaticus]
MPSQRRVKAFGLLVALVVLVTLYVTSSSRATAASDFYTKTQEALQAREYEAAAKQRDADDVGSRLKAAEEAAKKSAEQKGQQYLDSIAGGAAKEDDKAKGVAGRIVVQGGDDKKAVPGVAAVGGRPRDREAAKEKDESPEDHEVEVELNAILKKSPMIIFSKSYCPFSKKAKHILLDLYNIVPAPFVVELDQHPLGQKLQATLTESTGRRTVPNVLLMGKSIGGGDDIEELHLNGKLMDTVRSMGGSRIVQAERRKAGTQQKPLRV